MQNNPSFNQQALLWVRPKNTGEFIRYYRLHGFLLSLVSIFLLGCSFPFATDSEKKQSLNASANNNDEALTTLLQAELDAMYSDNKFPGATAAFVFADRRKGSAATGYADVEKALPMLPSSRLLAASIGKTLTAAAVLALCEEGKLTLDSPISQWLDHRPWFSRLPNHQSITLRSLLNHTSGLPDHVYSPEFAQQFSQHWQEQEQENFFTAEKLIEFISDKPPLFEVGKGWSYTDTGYVLIGLIIQEVTGEDFYSQVERRFIVPLQLTATTPSNTRNLPGLAAGYMEVDNTFHLPAKTLSEKDRMFWNPAIENAGGGWASNSMDLARWGLALFEGRAISNRYLQEMLSSVPVSTNTLTARYGLGVSINLGGKHGPIYGHAGWIPGYISSLRYYSQYHLAIAFQINTDKDPQNGTESFVQQMETRLANTLINTKAISEVQQ